MCLHVCVPHACSSCGGQKGASGPLELELQTVVDVHVVAGKLTWMPLESSQCFLPLNCLSNLSYWEQMVHVTLFCFVIKTELYYEFDFYKQCYNYTYLE